MISFDQLLPEQQIVVVKAQENDPKSAEEEKKYDQNDLTDFFRFSAEEILRRGQKKDTLPLTKANILGLLYGSEIQEFREKLKHRRIEEKRAEQDAGSENAYAKYDERA